MTNNEKKKDLCCEDECPLKAAEGYLENCRNHLRDVMKPAEKAAKELENATATEKVRLQGTKEPKAPNLKPYTESIPAKNRQEISKLITKARAEGRPWKIQRCNEALEAEGYRYTFITTSDKDSKLFPKSNIINNDKLILSEDVELIPVETTPDDFETIEVGGGQAPEQNDVQPDEPVDTPAEKSDDEEKPMTFEEQMDFLAADEDEAIAGYEKIIGECEDEHVKEQLEKILVEERAHKDFLMAVKEDRSLEYSHDEDEDEDEDEEDKDDKPEDENPDEKEPEDKPEEKPEDKPEDEEPLDEASSAEKKAFKNGGKDMDDLITGKALARVKDRNERAMLLHQKRMERQGKVMSDRPEVSNTLKRKEDQALADFEKKEKKMAAAGLTDEELLNENAKIELDDLELFKPWGGAKDVWQLIVDQDKLAALDEVLERFYPDGLQASKLNDILWFEQDWLFDELDIDPSAMVKAPEEDIIDGEAEVIDVEPEEKSDEQKQ